MPKIMIFDFVYYKYDFGVYRRGHGFGTGFGVKWLQKRLQNHIYSKQNQKS